MSFNHALQVKFKPNHLAYCLSILLSQLGVQTGALAQHGLLYLFLLRIFMPFDLLNYSAALSSVKYREYALATCLGIIGPAILFVFLGKNILEPFGLISLVLVLALFIWIARRLGKKFKNPNKNLY